MAVAAQDSDEVLMARVQAGDESACEAIYAAHAGRVAAYLLRSGF